MKCLKKNKHCKPMLCLKDTDYHVCSGINSKPTKYKKDVVTLCLKGKYVKNYRMEMTTFEALMIISVLSLSTSAEVGNG